MSAPPPAAVAQAEAMGRRAGRTWRTSGLPAPNPFSRGGETGELAKAWRRGYFAEARPRRAGNREPSS